jgi:hypothetical protein
MKKLAFLFIAIVAIASLSACRVEKVNEKNEPKKTFTLNLRDFNSISNQSNCNIFFTQSDTFKVVLKAPQHWYDTHTIAVRDGQLTIEEKPQKKQKGITVLRFNSHSQDAVMYVSAPSLTALSTAGSGDFYAETDLTGQSFVMKTAGSSTSMLKRVVMTDDFAYKLAGSGEINADTIQAKTASFRIAGSGDVRVKLVNVDDTKLAIAGSGSGTLNFDQCGHAKVEISGSGDITLAGTLRSLDKDIAGSGDIDTSKLQWQK